MGGWGSEGSERCKVFEGFGFGYPPKTYRKPRKDTAECAYRAGGILAPCVIGRMSESAVETRHK